MKKYNLIPLLLAAYLCFMCYMGFPYYMSGAYSPLRYFGVAALSAGCIIALRIVLKRRADKQARQKGDDGPYDKTKDIQ